MVGSALAILCWTSEAWESFPLVWFCFEDLLDRTGLDWTGPERSGAEFFVARCGMGPFFCCKVCFHVCDEILALGLDLEIPT